MTTSNFTVLPASFESFPDQARVWLFAAPASVSGSLQTALLESLSDNLTKWKSHGTEISANAAFLDEVTLLVVADFTQAHMSGCSIDRMILAVREAGTQAGVDLVDSSGVHYWQSGVHQFVDRQRFGELVSSGEVDGTTTVLDLTRIHLGEIRQGRWKAPASSTWHRRAYSLA